MFLFRNEKICRELLRGCLRIGCMGVLHITMGGGALELSSLLAVKTGRKVSGSRLDLGVQQGLKVQGNVAGDDTLAASVSMQMASPEHSERATARGLDRVLEKTPEQVELERLAQACRNGDGAAWQRLVESQHRRVYGICYRFCGSATDAEDLTQDVFLKVYRNMDSFDGTKGNFTTWLTTLTRNLLVDHFRRTRQDRVTDSIDVSLDAEGDGPTMADRLAAGGVNQHERLAQMELRAKVQGALKQLSPELREAVILRDLQDMDYKEIAVVLKVPEGTVKSRISRGRSELARLLQRIEGQVV